MDTFKETRGFIQHSAPCAWESGGTTSALCSPSASFLYESSQRPGASCSPMASHERAFGAWLHVATGRPTGSSWWWCFGILWSRWFQHCQMSLLRFFAACRILAACACRSVPAIRRLDSQHSAYVGEQYCI